MERVSVIVPLYKGSHFVDAILKNISTNYYCNNFYSYYELELVFVNDFPREIIELDLKTVPFPVIVVQNKNNLGIHASRLKGLEHSSGKYVLMLDQDDFITPDYLFCQINFLKKNHADIVVCDGWQDHFVFISDSYQMDKINDLTYYLENNNPILSPGQVVFKKKCIPNEWKTNILQKNGADDFYLWILLLKTGCTFLFNQASLYYHTPKRTVDSISSKNMTLSLEEVYSFLNQHKILSETELILLQGQIQKLHTIYDIEEKLPVLILGLNDRKMARTFLLETSLIREFFDIFVISSDDFILDLAKDFYFSSIKKINDCCDTVSILSDCNELIKKYETICFLSDKNMTKEAWSSMLGNHEKIREFLIDIKVFPSLGMIFPCQVETDAGEILYRDCFSCMDTSEINAIKARLFLDECQDLFYKNGFNLEAFLCKRDVLNIFCSIDWQKDKLFSKYKNNSGIVMQLIQNHCKNKGLDIISADTNLMPYIAVAYHAKLEINKLRNMLNSF